MDIIFLGTNGWYDTDMGNTICVLIKTPRYAIILDAGSGLSKLDRYLTDDREVYLFLSHFHLDHVTGLHVLAKFRFSNGLILCGPEGTRRMLNILVNHPFTMPLDRLPYRVTVQELPAEAEGLPFRVTTSPLRHTGLTLGYRFELEGKIVTYCPDTGYCPEAVGLGRNADLLIAECAYLPGEDQPGWPHLNPATAARIAQESGARRLALIHFDASRYPTREGRSAAAQYARQYHPDVFAAFDGMQVTV